MSASVDIYLVSNVSSRCNTRCRSNAALLRLTRVFILAVALFDMTGIGACYTEDLISLTGSYYHHCAQSQTPVICFISPASIERMYKISSATPLS